MANDYPQLQLVSSSSALRIWNVEVTIGLELRSELIEEYTGTLELKRGGK